MIKNILIIKSS